MTQLFVDLSSPSGITLALLPEILLTAWALVLLLVIGWRRRPNEYHRQIGQFTLIGLVAALVAVFWLWKQGATPNGLPLMIALDTFRYAASSILLIGAIFTVLLSLGYLGRERIEVPEYYVLLLFAVVGMLFMCGAADLLMVFLGLETMSVAVYVLAGIKRRSGLSAEAALKYFLLGAFASGFLLYGIALIYGATGTTNLTTISFQLADSEVAGTTMLGLGVALLLVGFGFKVAAVPFHMWAPDVYDGAPTPITGFMAAVVKAAGFAALIRVLITAFGDEVALWQGAIWWLAVITMLVGNLIALAQRRLKRMLAYSSIGHAGYLLVAVASGTAVGGSAFLFYAMAYTLMTMGAFAMLAVIGRDGESDVLIDDLSGLASQRPWLALAMAVFMLSLLGFPGTAGFIGKWYILAAAIGGDQGLLAVILVLASVVSAGFYLPVIMNMYMREPPADAEAVTDQYVLVGAARSVVTVAVLFLLLFGVWPNRMLDLANKGGQDLRPTQAFVISGLPR
jgi:NADH-quinone oxidoreductase subunit N